jgi:hypothetical protein
MFKYHCDETVQTFFWEMCLFVNICIDHFLPYPLKCGPGVREEKQQYVSCSNLPTLNSALLIIIFTACPSYNLHITHEFSLAVWPPPLILAICIQKDNYSLLLK